MSERIPFKVKLAATVLPVLGVAAAACDNGGKDQVTPTAVTGTAGASTVRPEATISAVISPTAIRTVESTPIPARTATTMPTAVPTSTPTGENTDMAVRFGEATGLQNNWLEVSSPESLKGLKEFTLIARVKVNGVPPDAIASKGDDVEAFAVFASLLGCLDGGMAVVIDDSRYCSGQRVPRGVFVDLAVTFKDRSVRFLIEDGVSVAFPTLGDVPTENGKFYVGASPKGTDEGFSGEIDDLIILNKALPPVEVRAAFALLRANNTRMLLVNNDSVAALWTFDRVDGFKDLSGHGNNATPRGEVSQVEVSK